MHSHAIIPLYKLTAAAHYRPYFDDKLRTERMGGPGRWLGPAAPWLRLHDPVTLRDFEQLLPGRVSASATPERQDSRSSHAPLGWAVLLRADPTTTALWALGPVGARQRIARAHVGAARSALLQLETTLTGRTNSPLLSNHPASVMAVFNSGADETQRPCLQTTAFLLNFGLRPDGTSLSYREDQVAELSAQVQLHYGVSLAAMLDRYLGSYQAVFTEYRVHPPADLLTRLSNCPEGGQSKETVPPARTADELWARWRVRGEANHWGRDHALRLITLAKHAILIDRLSRDHFFGSRRAARQWLAAQIRMKAVRRVEARKVHQKQKAQTLRETKPIAAQSQSQTQGHSH